MGYPSPQKKLISTVDSSNAVTDSRQEKLLWLISHHENPINTPEMTIMKRSVMTVAPIAPFEIQLKKKVTERTLPAKRRHNTNDLAASSGTLPYIARREIQIIT